jgi:hypothetical protein
MEQKFKFELGQSVKLKGSYRDAYITARGVIDYLEGHSIITYFITIDVEKRLIASEQELELREDNLKPKV